VMGPALTKIVPKRVLRGRWGSGDGVEKIIDGGSAFFGEIFVHAFDTKSVRREATAATPAMDDDGAGFWRVSGAKNKVMVFTALNNLIFLIQVSVSYTVKSPLIYFLHWAQKRNKEYNQQLDRFRADPTKIVETTPAFELVTEKCAAIAGEFDKLLDEGNLIWTKVHQLTGRNPRLHAGAKALIVGGACLAAADWDLRFTLPCNSYPLVFLRMLESGKHVPCEHRRNVAKRLVDASECCLVQRDSDSIGNAVALYTPT
jgi:hypothetical protein